jgi:DNA-binding FadR family transcriptional regulator
MFRREILMTAKEQQPTEPEASAAPVAKFQAIRSARAATNLEFHRILARMTGNPIMVIVMNGVLNVLAEFIGQVGHYDNNYVLPSRRRFLKHLVARDSDAAVAEMESILKRLQRSYLSKVEGGAADEAPAAPASAKPRSKPAAKTPAKPAAKATGKTSR